MIIIICIILQVNNNNDDDDNNNMHKPVFFQGNETHKILWDFEKQKKKKLLPARRPVLVLINKKKRTCSVVNFAVLADHGLKIKESEKRDKHLDLTRKLKKQLNMKVTVIPIVVDALGMIHKDLEKGLKETEIRLRIETIQTTEKSPGDKRRLAVNETPEKDHQLTLVWKPYKDKITLIL